MNKDMTLMVRQLQPTETGLPMQLYFFTDTVVWVDYEGIQSDVFDHVLAVIPEFGLRVFRIRRGRTSPRCAMPFSKRADTLADTPAGVTAGLLTGRPAKCAAPACIPAGRPAKAAGGTARPGGG